MPCLSFCRRSLLPAAVALLSGACSNTITNDPAVFVPVTGEDAEPWTQDPVATQVRVSANDLSGAGWTTLAEPALPFSSYTFTGTDTESGAAFEVAGLDAGGSTVVRGRTIPLVLSSLAGETIPVFVARTGAWARAPDTLEHAHVGAVAGVALGRYIVVAGGTSDPTQPDVYDLVSWSGIQGESPLPLAPESMAIVDAQALLINGDAGVWLDLSSGQSGATDPPPGVAFSEVAGGRTVEAPDGTIYVVGASRTSGDPSSAVLRIQPTTGTIDGLRLTAPRLGATVAFANGIGLMVAGGSATAPGLEILPVNQDAFTTTPYPPDPVQGAALAVIGSADAPTVFLVGGKDPASAQAPSIRQLDPSCSSSCAIADLGSLGGTLTAAQAFPVLDGSSAVAVGSGASGETAAYYLNGDGSAQPIALKVPRRDATALVLPNGAVGIAGGSRLDDQTAALQLETFTP